MKFIITNFGQSRTIMVKGTGYYLTGRGGFLKTNNKELAEASATYPGIDVEAEETKPIKVEKIIEKKPIEVKPLEEVKIIKKKKTRSKK